MLVDPVLEPGGGPGDADGGDHAVRRAATGAAIAVEAGLELVDGGGVAACAGSSSSSAAQRLARGDRAVGAPLEPAGRAAGSTP